MKRPIGLHVTNQDSEFEKPSQRNSLEVNMDTRLIQHKKRSQAA